MTHHYGATRIYPARIYQGMETAPKPKKSMRSAEIGKMCAECQHCKHLVRAVIAPWNDPLAVPPVRIRGYMLSKHTDEGLRARDLDTPCLGSGTGARHHSIFEEEDS